MSPEERFQRLRDEELWNEIRMPRAASAPEARWLIWRLVVPVAGGLIVAALVVAGVNVWRGTSDRTPAIVIPTSISSPEPTATPSASPTATSSAPTESSEHAAPAQLFGGDCENVLPDAKVDAIAGIDMSNDPDVVGGVMGDYEGKLGGATGFVTRQIGGLNCAWFSQATNALISITFVPADRVTALDKNVECGVHASGQSGCAIDIVENGVRIFGGVGQTGGAEDERIASGALTLLKPAVDGLSGVTGNKQGPGDWPLPVDCDELNRKVDIAGGIQPVGTDAAPSPVYADLLNDGLRLRCDWASGIAEYRSGGAWAEPDIAALDGATELSIEGFDHVIKVPNYDSFTYHFFRGTNWLIIDQLPTEEAPIIQFATEVANGLDKL